jgi:fatty-acyl-CoA synthase
MSAWPRCPPRFDPLSVWRRLAPERIALVDRTRDARLSYAELEGMTRRWLIALRAMGVRSGDRVAVLAGTRAELFALLFACSRSGSVLVPLNWRLTPVELAPMLENARPAAMLTDGTHRGAAEAACALAGVRPAWGDLDAPGSASSSDCADADAPGTPDDALLVLYTSGSTGTPKGAMLPHRQLFFNAIATTTGWQLGPSDVAPVATPCFHTGGWNVFATPLLERGGTVVLFDRFAPDEFLVGLAEERCTAAMVVPTQLTMLRESAHWGEPLPALRFLISGGAPLPRVLAEAASAAGYAIREGYGLTECGPNCFSISQRAASAKPGRVGWPSPYLEARLTRANGSETGIDEPGELWLRGPQMFAGYFADPERTAEVVTAEGWLRTGDLAERDADGAVRICGRLKEMYISGGENVFPAEVEAALSGLPEVLECVVVGVPDERWGEVGHAFVVPRNGVPLDERAVVRAARERLAGYKIPKRVSVLAELPRLGSGKPDRRALARRAADDQS